MPALAAVSGAYLLRPFRPADYHAIHDALQVAGWPALTHSPELVGQLYVLTPGSQAWTLCHQGAILGCGGIQESWQGFGIAWLIFGPGAREHHAFMLARTLRRSLAQIEGRYRRIEADVLGYWTLGGRLMAFLGFEVESHMRHYGPQGQTFTKWVKFPHKERVCGD